MTERTYTREDMARAWRDGWWSGIDDQQAASDGQPVGTPNPYEDEEA